MSKFFDTIIEVDYQYRAFTSLPDQHWYPHGWLKYLSRSP